jgi:hypothetical protein
VCDSFHGLFLLFPLASRSGRNLQPVINLISQRSKGSEYI